jgi:predicted RNA binding protein YcfA (HicA-like mRNA interferase family)
MSKLPSFNSKEIIKILNKKGFKLDRTRGSHSIYINEKTRKRVVVPIHNKDLPKGTFLEILKQAGIDKKDLEDFL